MKEPLIYLKPSALKHHISAKDIAFAVANPQHDGVMAYMTDAEAERLDEYYTKNTIMTVPGSLGTVAKLKQKLRPGEVLSFKCIIEEDEDGFDDARCAPLGTVAVNAKSGCPVRANPLSQRKFGRKFGIFHNKIAFFP